MKRPALLSVGLLAVPLFAAAADDAEYTRLIREYTTDPMFMTELVDHLPASATVPTPLEVPRVHRGRARPAHLRRGRPRYFRALEKASPRVKVFSHRARPRRGAR